MRSVKRSLLSIILLIISAAGAAYPQARTFGHVVVIIQENRTPDNLFHGLCIRFDSSSTNPNP
jgi:phospholipase C